MKAEEGDGARGICCRCALVKSGIGVPGPRENNTVLVRGRQLSADARTLDPRRLFPPAGQYRRVLAPAHERDPKQDAPGDRLGDAEHQHQDPAVIDPAERPA